MMTRKRQRKRKRRRGEMEAGSPSGGAWVEGHEVGRDFVEFEFLGF